MGGEILARHLESKNEKEKINKIGVNKKTKLQ
jgi:hypothetical protein